MDSTVGVTLVSASAQGISILHAIVGAGEMANFHSNLVEYAVVYSVNVLRERERVVIHVAV